jgi:hypothetical protein
MNTLIPFLEPIIYLHSKLFSDFYNNFKMVENCTTARQLCTRRTGYLLKI